MQRSAGLVPVDEIYITHYHADHYLGLPGLLKTYDADAASALRVLGPPGLVGLFKTLARIFGRIPYEIDLVELDDGGAIAHDEYGFRSFPVDHGVRTYGYAMVEDERPGHFDPARARELGVTEVTTSGSCSGAERSRAQTAPCAPTR